MKKISLAIVTMFIALTAGMPFAKAKSFTLVDNQTKETYVCSTGGGGGGDGGSCVSRVQAVCKKEFSSGCYESASSHCGGRGARYASCVEDTYAACRTEFRSGCYESAVSKCKQ